MTKQDQLSLYTLFGIISVVALVVEGCIVFGVWILIPVLFLLVSAVAWVASDPPPGDHLSFPFRLVLVTTVSALLGMNIPLLVLGEQVELWSDLVAQCAVPGIVAGVIVGVLLFYRVRSGARAVLLVAEGLSLVTSLAVTMHWISVMSSF